MTKATLNAAIPVLPVGHIEQATQFYQQKLGFDVGHSDEGYAVLIRDQIEIHLWSATDDRWKGRVDEPIVSGAETFLAGTASCRVHVTGLDAIYAEMQKVDVIHPNGRLDDKPYGFREFAILDHDGNLLTFFCTAQDRTESS